MGEMPEIQVELNSVNDFVPSYATTQERTRFSRAAMTFANCKAPHN
jgi:hypothetical protein